MRGIIIKALIGCVFFFGIFTGGYLLGFQLGQDTPKTVLVKGVTGLEDKKPEQVDFGTFWQAWDVIDQEYLRHDKVANVDKVQGAVR